MAKTVPKWKFELMVKWMSFIDAFVQFIQIISSTQDQCLKSIAKSITKIN